MSDEQHTWDIQNFPDMHPQGCLNRHVSYFAASNPCSHRAQAYDKAMSDQSTYKWPRDVPGPPKANEDAWDITTAGNFQHCSQTPFWHEAHHMVPNSVLNQAIAKVAEGSDWAAEILMLVRGGLIEEEYNLNHQRNMIILPMLEVHSRALKLPRHRETPQHRGHSNYSKYVSRQLTKIFVPLSKDAKKCDARQRKYKKCKAQIEDLSDSLYPQIKAAGAVALDSLFKRSTGMTPP